LSAVQHALDLELRPFVRPHDIRYRTADNLYTWRDLECRWLTIVRSSRREWPEEIGPFLAQGTRRYEQTTDPRKRAGRP
jgi:hypothetical protein